MLVVICIPTWTSGAPVISRLVADTPKDGVPVSRRLLLPAVGGPTLHDQPVRDRVPGQAIFDSIAQPSVSLARRNNRADRSPDCARKGKHKVVAHLGVFRYSAIPGGAQE